MSKPTFADALLELDNACMVLRSFTLGRRGTSQRGGRLGIRRVNAQCNRLKKLFADGPNAQKVSYVIASARTRVLAAETRLALLQKK
jgi:hypothetical protein